MYEQAKAFEKHQKELLVPRQYFFIDGQMWVQVGNQQSQPISVGTLTAEIRQFLGASDLDPVEDGEFLKGVVEQFGKLTRHPH
jgi:hypothetical protein